MVISAQQQTYPTPLDVALQLAPNNFLGNIRTRIVDAGVAGAVRHHDGAPIFDWVMGLFALQGISDRAAIAYQKAHGSITLLDVQPGLATSPCRRLASWWHFVCGYRKTSQTCAEPDFISSCALPRHDARKGTLAQAAYGFALFIRDVCDSNFVTWIDQRLAEADDASSLSDRGRRMGNAVLVPLMEIPGTGPKIWSMILAELLLGADPARERWMAAGASMIVVDTLTHTFLHRTGTLRSHQSEHAYEPRCYQPGGCADVIDRIAMEIDARAYDPHLPSFCPRFVQHALWYFCAEGGWNICNGRQIDDRYPCRQSFCPARPGCARLAGPK